MKIGIIGGHGSAPVYRRGFKQVDSLNECHEGQNNYRVYELLKKNLEEYDGVTVTSARPNMDDDPQLSARGRAGTGVDLLLQVHSNAGGGRGPTMYMRPDAPDELVDLSTKIRTEIRSAFDFNARARDHNYRTLDGVWRSTRGPGKSYYAELRYCPHPNAILLEMAFHDHDGDARYLRKQRQAFADAITRAVVAHYGLKKLEGGVLHTTTGTVNFRTGPGVSYPVIRNLEKGTGLTVYAEDGKWAKVRQGGDMGYISTDYIEPAKSRLTAPEGKLYRVAVDSFKYRDNAEDLQRRLKADGHNAFLVVIDDPRR